MHVHVTYTRVSDIVDSESCHGHAWSRHIHTTEWFRGRENSPDLPQAAVREVAIEGKPGDVTGPRNATMAEIFDSLLLEQSGVSPWESTNFSIRVNQMVTTDRLSVKYDFRD